MSASAFVGMLLALGGPVKPLVLVTNLKLGKADRLLVEAPESERARLVRQGGYELREFGEFVLATPPDILRLRDAAVQTSLMGAIARRTSGGDRTLRVGDLDAPEGASLREKVRRLGSWGRGIADAPDLRLYVGADTTFRMKRGDKEMTFVVHPTGPAFGQDDARMAALDPSRVEELKRAAPLALLPSGTGRLTFLLAPGTPGIVGLERIAEAQAALLKDARAAREAWDGAKRELLEALKGDLDGIYERVPGQSRPDFGDLKPELQYRWGTFFGMENRRELGGTEPLDWLRSANTLSASTQPVLLLMLASGQDSATTHSSSIHPIEFVCPVGP